MYDIVKKQDDKPNFPFYPFLLDEDDSSSGTIQTHPRKSHIGVLYQRIDVSDDYMYAYKFSGETDWVIADEEEVVAEATRDARRWLTLEKGGWRK